jgi:hypothetical protein
MDAREVAMTTELGLAMAAVVVAWILVGFAVRRWGPGLVRRHVRCPEKHCRATVMAMQVESGYGAIRTSDVLACDLLGNRPVDCAKHCLSRL